MTSYTDTIVRGIPGERFSQYGQRQLRTRRSVEFMPRPTVSLSNMTEKCPHDGCGYTSSEQGVKIHYGRAHDGTIRGVSVTCDECGEETRTEAYREDRDHHFCDPDCYQEWWGENIGTGGETHTRYEGGPVEVECAKCGSTVERKQNHFEKFDRHFCDATCQATWLSENIDFNRPSGEDHWNWKGGQDDFYLTNEWDRARRKARKRANGECQACGSNQDIHVHHIRPVSDGGAKFDEENLMTLCEKCHIEAHRNPKDSDYIDATEV